MKPRKNTLLDGSFQMGFYDFLGGFFVLVFFVSFLGAELESWQLLIAPIVCIKRKIGLIKAVALGVGLQIKDNCLL